MGFLDSGNWKLYTPDPDRSRRPTRGAIRLTISAKVVTLSPEARKAMGDPSYIEVWRGKRDGRVIFIGSDHYTSGCMGVRNTKGGVIRFRKPEFVAELMEHLIIWGNVTTHIGSDDKPLPGAYFCVDGKEFKERNPKDRRKWLVGVEFDLAKAYYCQMSMEGVQKAQEALREKRTQTNGE